MARIYDQLALVWKGEAPIDSVPATILEFNVYKAAEKVLQAGKHLRAHMLDHDFHPQIGDLVREAALKIHAAGRAKRLAKQEQVRAEKVRIHRPHWDDWGGDQV